MIEKYLTPNSKGRWTISRLVNGKRVALVQDAYLDDPADAEAVLRALGIPSSPSNLDIYFPYRPDQGRCPTLELMERCNVLDPTNPTARQQRDEVGV